MGLRQALYSIVVCTVICRRMGNNTKNSLPMTMIDKIYEITNLTDLTITTELEHKSASCVFVARNTQVQ